MLLKFARGDSYEKGFVLRNKSTKQPILTEFNEVYFTVKNHYDDDEYCFQKRMSDGNIVYDGQGHYTLFIYPEDTDGMAIGKYDCDIEFVKEYYKRTFAGELELTKEVTHVSNE